MIHVEDRQHIAKYIQEAHTSGARLCKACKLTGIDVRTFQRWQVKNGLQCGDNRPLADRSSPSHTLTDEEREAIIAVVNEPRFADVPPARIVPTLADEGRYLASESTFYRTMRTHNQVTHRGRAKPPSRAPRQPTTHVATGPNQVWCWDVTYLPRQVLGQWFFMTLILDLYSRKIVGFAVEETDSAENSAILLKRTVLKEGIHALSQKPVLHSDNGSTMKGTSVLAMMSWLGLTPSHSRPRVSNDNAFSESLFRTAKYRPEFPGKFDTLEEVRTWATQFVRWYNTEHQHSGIRYVTPEARHAGTDRDILTRRHAIYQAAREAKPERWSKQTRNWNPIETVTLNPERDKFTKMTTFDQKNIQTEK